MRLALEAGKETVELAVRHGVRGVPVSGPDLVEQGPERITAGLRERGLEVCQVGAFGLNPLSGDADALAVQVAVVEQVIELAPAAGCRTVVIPGGNHHSSAFGGTDRRNFGPEALARVAEVLRPLCRRAERAGVRLSIEPYIKSAVHSPQAFLELARLVGSDALAVNFDVTNFYDLRDLIDPTDICRRAATALRGVVGLVHVKEIGLREGFHIQAGLCPLTEGPTDWGLVLELAAAAAPPECWVLLEHVMSAQEAERSITHLRAVARKRGVTLGP